MVPVGLLAFVVFIGGSTLLLIGWRGGQKRFAILGALVLWLGLTAAWGYSRAGWRGAVLLTTPTVVVFLGLLYYFSAYLLPLENPRQRREPFQALLAWVVGTNFPYYLIHSNQWGDNKVEQHKEMGGKPFREFLPGPGVVISRCDHAPVISDGVRFKGVRRPGVSFLGPAERVTQAIDLREQLRTFTVEARTKDGIGVSIPAFTPFRIDCGEAQPQLNQPFPLRHRSAFLALHKAQFIEHQGKGQVPERMEAHQWDDLPQVLGKRILRDIIAEYRFDDLCAPYRLADDPRAEIINRFKEKLGKDLRDYGIQLMGGGIGNILPTEEKSRQIFEQRIRAWQAHWVRRVMQRQAEGQRSRMRQIEKARAQAQVEAIRAISDRLSRLQEQQGIVSIEEIVNLFIDVIHTMAVQPLTKRLLPPTVLEPLKEVQQKIGGSFKGGR
jgi:regulator of protease activity HflC (stomatin/prohibitin superfamily)